MAITKVDDRGLNTPIDLLDNEKIRLGTGNDIEIYHSGISNVFATSNGNIELIAGSEYLGKFIPNGAVELYHDNSKRLETTSSGITVTGAITNNGAITAGNGNGINWGDTSARIIGESGGSGYLRFDTNGGEKIRIDSSGRILIGTTSILHSQSNKLYVAGTDSSTSISLNRYADSAFAPYIHFRKSRSGTVGGNTIVQDDDLLGRIYFEGNDGSSPVSAAYIEAHVDGTPGNQDMPGRLEFLTTADGSPTPVERMRIGSTGEIGINLTNPEAYGSSGHGFNGLVVQAPSGNYSGITIKSAYNGGGGLLFSDGSGSTAELYNVALTADHTNKRLNFYVDGSTVCRLTQYGFHPNPADSAASTALDDYEEGTWTPTITNGIDGGAAYAEQRGFYIKIGNLVQVSFYLQFANSNTGSTGNGNVIQIGGLPVNSADTTPNYSSGGIVLFTNANWDNATSQIVLYLGDNASTFICYRDRGTNATLTGGNPAKAIYGVATYRSG